MVNKLMSNIGDSVNTFRYKAGTVADLTKLACEIGPFKLSKGIKQYPWIPDVLLHINNMYKTLADGREGHYKEANLTTVQYLVKAAMEIIGPLLKAPETIVLREDVISPEIFWAMGLNDFVPEMMTHLFPIIGSTMGQDYLDIAENNGVFADTCSLPRGAMGMTLAGDMPKPAAIVASTMPCDAGMTSYTVIAEKLQVPLYTLDIPHDTKSEQSNEYVVKQLKEMIAFLEDHTEGRMDYDRLKEICDRRNKTFELEMDLWEMMRQKPAPMAADPIILGHLLFFIIQPASKLGLEYFTKLMELTEKIMESGEPAIKEERFRTILWNTPTVSFPDLASWMENTWGSFIAMDMVTFNRQPYIDTSTPETMLKGLAHLMLDAPMARHTRGPSENFFRDMLHVVDYFDLDFVTMTEHVGCKNTKALNGMIREMCREKNIPVMFIDYDYIDPRIQPPEAMKKQINTFMENIMKAERLDSAQA
jgi:benzoyl-CoA reductase/2-hydroxyglutaryl-CoA dehydratase subunit BcrC/BadD/HgdB